MKAGALRNTNAAECHSVQPRAADVREKQAVLSAADSLFGSLSEFPWPFAGEGQENRGLLTVPPTNKT